MSNNCRFEFVAAYCIMGEAPEGGLIDAHSWMEDRIATAVDDNALEAGTVLNVMTGYWGLQYITFIGEVEMPMESTPEETKVALKKTLDIIVHDTDVEVHWINRIA